MIEIPKLSYQHALVTGGAGFIGSHIIEALLRQGIRVTCVDDFVAGKRENLRGMPNEELLTVADCDITDAERLDEAMKGVEVVFHNAASKKTICLNDPRRDLEINAKGAFNIMESALKHGVSKVVHASTGSVYGEAQYYPQNENHPLEPNSYYGVSKLAGEKYALAFHRLYGIDVSVLRYFHVYGARQESADGRGGVVAIFCRRSMAGLPLVINGDGRQQRSFTYVKDVVRANFTVADSPQATGQAYNCASGLKITIGELAGEINRITGNKAPTEFADWTPGDIKVFDVDNQKIGGLGVKQWTSFPHGLAETIAWYQTQR